MAATGTKYALLVGCNYTGTPYELKGCINDVKSVYDVLTKNDRFGFNKSNIQVLTDEAGSEKLPTGDNIKVVLSDLLSGANYGDLVFFFFSGHGTLLKPKESESGKEEPAILPSDYNIITSIDFRKFVNEATAYGVTLVIMSDSGHSGKLIDKEEEQIGPDQDPNNKVQRQAATASNDNKNKTDKKIPLDVILQQLSPSSTTTTNAVSSIFVEKFGSKASLIFQNGAANPLPGDDDLGILLNGCQADEVGYEIEVDGWFHGVYTLAVIDVLKNNRGPLTNYQLVEKVTDIIWYYQNPGLYCSKENAKTFFLKQGI